MPLKFVVHPNAVAAEVIDGEAIIMQLTSGMYFSSRGTGAAIWELMQSAVALDDIAQALASLAGQPIERIQADVMAFAAAAARHDLGELIEGERTATVPSSLRLAVSWSPPVLESFSDMQDLLLLDPVHDVSTEMGWPMQKPV